MSAARSPARLCDVRLDEVTLPPCAPEAAQDRRVAIFDLLENNHFALVGDAGGGPYVLTLATRDQRLSFQVADERGALLREFLLSLTPLRRVIRDYFMVCDSYYEAIRSATPQQIEALDAGRRGLHNEGSELLTERLREKVELDHDTARRLFTLICALHARP
jgi:uncharacterized protein (UPF0262 family)